MDGVLKLLKDALTPQQPATTGAEARVDPLPQQSSLNRWDIQVPAENVTWIVVLLDPTQPIIGGRVVGF